MSSDTPMITLTEEDLDTLSEGQELIALTNALKRSNIPFEVTADQIFIIDEDCYDIDEYLENDDNFLDILGEEMKMQYTSNILRDLENKGLIHSEVIEEGEIGFSLTDLGESIFEESR